MPERAFGQIRQARRPGMYLALGVGMAVLYLSVTQGLSFFFPALILAYLGLVLYRIIVNPGRGFLIDDERIDWLTAKGRFSAALDEVAKVAIGKGKQGQTVVVLKMRDGRAVPLSGVERLSREILMREFGERGIAVEA